MAAGESNLEPLRYEQGRPMLFAGIRRKHTFASMGKDIPRQWEDFLKLGELPGQVGTTAYGAICGGDPKTQTMEYMCAVEVKSFDARAEGSRPHARAGACVTPCSCTKATSRRSKHTWKQIFSIWLPSSGMQSAQTPDFEVYDERFDGATGDGGVEIWLGVKPAK